jgi:hypothetical protein
MTDQIKNTVPIQIPGDNQQLSVDDLLLLNGRVNAELELERSKRLILVQAYNQIKIELDALKAKNYEEVVVGNP